MINNENQATLIKHKQNILSLKLVFLILWQQQYIPKSAPIGAPKNVIMHNTSSGILQPL